MNDHPNNKDAWLRRLQQTSLPSFSESLNKLSNLDVFSDSHSSELSRTILKDPSLTAAVLKLANSAQFNNSGNSIRTVSRGVMLLGHKSIHEICTSCLLLDEFLKGGASITLKAVLARSFHAAVQAKELANARGDRDIEEIFISSLLLNIGEISIYSALGSNDKLVQALTAGYPFLGGKEKDLIGCYFNELTLALCHSWGIAPMIAETLSGGYTEASSCRSVLLANSFAMSCEQQGFKAAINTHVKTISRFCNKPVEEMTSKLTDAAETSKENLKAYGLDLAGVNNSPTYKKKEISNEISVDKAIMFDAIQELSTLVQTKFDINIALQVILEGLSRGAGFNYCLIGLLNPQRNRLTAKHVIERGPSRLKEGFEFHCIEQISEINQKVLINRNIVSFTDLREKSRTSIEIKKQLLSTQSIWGPLVVENKVIGCIYADNGTSSQLITTDQTSSFELFVNQAKANLTVLK